jgi:hypothetical protein
MKTTVTRLYRWALRGPLHYVLVVGLLTYALPLDAALTGYLAALRQVPVELSLAVASALAGAAGLIFGLGTWLTSGRWARKDLHA